eukprot:COSAG02_NODE_296_length_25401_cov_7.672437_17_plen_171_part_00
MCRRRGHRRERMLLSKRSALGRLLLVGCAAASGAGGHVCPEGFAETYEITGCADPAHCGVYQIVSAHCEPGAHCPSKSDRTLCDRAPVYQLEGQPDGPVLHRCERACSLAPVPPTNNFRGAPSSLYPHTLTHRESCFAVPTDTTTVTSQQSGSLATPARSCPSVTIKSAI